MFESDVPTVLANRRILRHCRRSCFIFASNASYWPQMLMECKLQRKIESAVAQWKSS